MAFPNWTNIPLFFAGKTIASYDAAGKEQRAGYRATVEENLELKARISRLCADIDGLTGERDRAYAKQQEAEDQFHKAKDWNALCELELKTLRERMDNAEEDMSRAGLREGQAMETIYLLKNSLLELCEKMEAGISGPEETKRARLLLEEIKANQDECKTFTY